MKISKQRLAEIIKEEYNATLKEAEFVGHHAEIEGETYVDSNFLNSVKKIRDTFPGELKSMGHGEFYLETPKGTVQFDRSRGQSVQGTVADFVGRAHQLYGEPPELADELMAAMEAAGASEAVSIVGVGGSDSEGYSKVAGTRPMEEEEKPTFAGHEDQFMEKVKQLIAADEMKVEIGDDFEETMIHFIQQDRTPQEAADRYIGLHDEGPAGYSSFNESTPEEYKMKISKQRLAEIIQEEYNAALEEDMKPPGEGEADRQHYARQRAGEDKMAAGQDKDREDLERYKQEVDMSLLRGDKKENWTVHYLPFDIMRNSIWAAQIVAAHDDLYQYVSSNVKPEDTVMGQECEDCQSDGDDTAKGDEFLKSVAYAYKVKDTPAGSGQASPEEMAGYESDYIDEEKSKMKISRERLMEIVQEEIIAEKDLK